MEAHIGCDHYVGVPTASAFHHDPKRMWKQMEFDSVEPFVVEDLLDFSNEELAEPIDDENDKQSNHSVNSSITVAERICSNSTPDKARFQNPNSLEEEELCVACDNIAELEWLSTFVEDSFSTDEALKSVDSSAPLAFNSNNRSELSINRKEKRQMQSSLCGSDSTASPERLETTLSGRARSKRSRTGVRVWSSGLDLSSNSRSSLECMYAFSDSTSFRSFLFFHTPALSPEIEFLTPKESGDHSHHLPRKAAKTRRKAVHDTSQPRRCTHCLTQRTPQWRAGPAGPKTLCNACGVRFKSGRLPEYRPAMSPSFISHQHSNSHTKVLEMRKHKEVLQQHQQEEKQQQEFVEEQEKENSSQEQ